jgi:4-aminobutyrate aminotransferase-like enzyme/Ser/Thr protein kinase RdoA (MazF antagonist)
MLHLADAPHTPATPRPLPTRNGATLARWDGGAARLLTWVPGEPYAAAEHSDRLWTAVGHAVGGIVAALADFAPSRRRHHLWDLGRAAETIAETAGAVADPHRRAVARRAVDAFLAEVAPQWAALPQQQIHNDANERNLLVAGDTVTGLVDFGDTVWSARVAEPAVAATYAMLDRDDPVACGGAVIAGFTATVPLEPAETAALLPLIRLRLALSVSIAASRLGSGNPHHQVTTAEAWDLLERLDAADPTVVAARLARAAGHPPAADAPVDLEARRRRVLLPSLSLHYAEPLQVVRGAGAHLFDEQARRYLDCVNNVAHVGHGERRVADAAHTQARTLNTNTRYLHPAIVEYGERLAALLPDGLEVCALLNSGSEANELAVRMARAHTGGTDMVVLEHGYHGNTSTTVDLSPYKFDGPGGAGRPDWVHVLPSPDPYRTRFTGPQAATRYGEAADAVIARARQQGRSIAGIIAEPIIGCGGQIVPEAGVLAAAYAAVRDAGGVCIADEVQVGFGRVGDAFWGFELHGVVPDIVTMGKPMGNGHPLGAVVTTREVAASFANGMEYFNTFGGNPVSAVVGLAVLDVIERRRLQDRARELGSQLAAALRELADRHHTIGDVRGAGLFLGVELVEDRRTREPHPELASHVVEHARAHGVLLSIDGPHHNVLKIKPPLVFSDEDAARLVAAVDGALTASAAAH